MSTVDHDHVWTPCDGCISILRGKGCPCAGIACPDCNPPTAEPTNPDPQPTTEDA